MVHDSAIDPNTATRAFTIRVSEPLTITTTTLPFGILNTAYSALVEASGGFPPYAWSLSSGDLPPGLDLDSSTGVISGTPTSTGTYSFTIGVEDSTLPVAQSYTSDLAIEITLGGGGGDLVAHYLFNGNADDQSGNGNNGTVTAATLPEDRFGNADSAYSFNGSTSGIVIPNSLTLNIPNFQTGYSIVAWVKPTTAPPPGNPDEYYGEIVSKGAAGFEIRIGSNLNVEACHASSSGVVCTTSGYLSLNAWALVAVTWDAASGTWQIYYDGAPSGSPSTVAGLQAAPIDGDIMIGRDSSFDRWHFPGVIDDVRIYDYALTATNIQEIYVQGAPAPAFVKEWGGLGTGDGQFNSPQGVAVDKMGGYIYVTQIANDRVQKFTSDGGFVTKWGGEGSGNGTFFNPRGIAVNSSGEFVYVADQGNHLVQKFTSAGVFETQWGGQGSEDGKFQQPLGIAVDDSGFVYVVDSGNGRIQKFDSDGIFQAKFSSPNPTFSPRGVAVDNSGGYLYVAEDAMSRVAKFTLDGVFLIEWSGGLSFPIGIAVDDSGFVYVADSWHDQAQKFTSTGVFVTKWGSTGSGDGQFQLPTGIAVDNSGFVYVVDANNNRIQKFR